MNAPLRILVVHNSYQWRGGEDVVFESEIDLLRRHGHEVETYTRSNEAIVSIPKISLLQQTFWSSRTVVDIDEKIRHFKPDVIHAHNTFPLVSPSLFWEASSRKIPVVQTLHNFRLICPQAMFLRNNQICEKCLGGSTWHSVVHRCYRNSRAQSAVLSSMLMLHRHMGTYVDKVARFIALNKFCLEKFVQGGLPADRISIKPNFVSVPECGKWVERRSGGLYVGRLSEEKGVRLLLGALDRLPHGRVTAIGEGPLSDIASAHPRIDLLGRLDRSAVLEHMRGASYLIMPSIWYETFGMVAVEAFASGLPVIAARLGCMKDMISDGVTGLLFEPGSEKDLAAKIAWAECHPAEMQQMGRRALMEYRLKYTAARNYEQLLKIYHQAIVDQASRDEHELEAAKFAPGFMRHAASKVARRRL